MMMFGVRVSAEHCWIPSVVVYPHAPLALEAAAAKAVSGLGTPGEIDGLRRRALTLRWLSSRLRLDLVPSLLMCRLREDR